MPNPLPRPNAPQTASLVVTHGDRADRAPEYTCPAPCQWQPIISGNAIDGFTTTSVTLAPDPNSFHPQPTFIQERCGACRKTRLIRDTATPTQRNRIDRPNVIAGAIERYVNMSHDELAAIREDRNNTGPEKWF